MLYHESLMQNSFTAKFSQECKHVYVCKNQRNVSPHKSKKQSKVHLMPVVKHIITYPTQTQIIFDSFFIVRNCWNYSCDVRGINSGGAEPTMRVLWDGEAAFKAFCSHFPLFYFCTYTTHASLLSCSILQKWWGVKKKC